MEFVRCYQLDDGEYIKSSEIVYVNLNFVKIVYREEREERATILETYDGKHYECESIEGAEKLGPSIEDFKKIRLCEEEFQTVNHGKWIICSDGYYPYCSECKHEPQGREMTKFCPNCGAKMDGDCL